jgi:hypothetical protein
LEGADQEERMNWLIRDPHGRWEVGDVLEFQINGHLIDRGVVQEIILRDIYRVDLESGDCEVSKVPKAA